MSHNPRTASLALLLLVAAGATADPLVAPGTWRVASESSELRVLLYRGGLLGRMGHNHVVSHRGISGCAAVGEPFTDGDIRLTLPAAGFDVDREDARRAEGEDFPVPVPEDDIAGTRANMLGPKLLDADAHPDITLHSTGITGDWPNVDVTFAVNIAGSQSTFTLPVTLHAEPGSLTARGTHTVSHGEIGLKPFSAALGALRVRDEMLFRYTLRLAPAGDSGCEGALAVVDDDAVAAADARAE